MAQSAANRVYQDFEPFFEWTEDEASATLVVMLPGFTKDQVRVQVTSTAVLRVNGERQVIENIWRRFGKEFSIPPYCDTNEVSAKFERGMLSVKFPKLITPAKPQQQEAVTKPQQRPSSEPEAPAQAQQESPQTDQKEPISDEKEKNKTEEQVAPENVAQKTTEVKTPTAQGRQQAKMTQRLKTRMLDLGSSLRSADDQDVKKGLGGTGDTGRKRWKILINMIVAILLILVFGVYVKNAFWSSSSSSQGESKLPEF